MKKDMFKHVMKGGNTGLIKYTIYGIRIEGDNYITYNMEDDNFVSIKYMDYSDRNVKSFVNRVNSSGSKLSKFTMKISEEIMQAIFEQNLFIQ